MEKYVNLDDVENRIIALSNITSSPFIDCNTAIYGLLSGLIQSIDVWSPDESIYIDGDNFCSSAERKVNNKE